MLQYHTFKREYLKKLYSINTIDEKTIKEDYKIFSDGMTKSEEIALSLFNESEMIKSLDSLEPKLGMDISSLIGVNSISDIIGDDNDDYNKLLINLLMDYLKSVYANERLDGSGMCLIENLVGRACQMIHNDELLGVVRGIDENKKNLLIIDFGDVDEVKVDIDELIIVGQKK